MNLINRGSEVKRPTFRGIQALRGFAACMVVIHHATQQWSLYAVGGGLSLFWANGAAGVDIFFVISGFVMAVSTIGREHKTHPALNFLGRRLIRLVPLYWVVTFIFLFKLELLRRFPGFQNGPRLVEAPFGYILSSLFFIPYRNSLDTIAPLVVAGWTLSYEMFFYLLFAGALALRVGVARTLTPVMITLAAVGLFYKESWPTLTVLASPLLMEFLAGLLLGHVVIKGYRLNATSSLVLGILALPALLFVSPWDTANMRFLERGIPAFLLVLATAMTEDQVGRFWPRWVLLIGDASYSLYLSHLLVIAFLIKIFIRSHIWSVGVVRRQDEILTALVCLFVSTLVAIPLYLLIEKRITQILRRNLMGKDEPA
jgi:exopolysaccharide production protein ExoZ